MFKMNGSVGKPFPNKQTILSLVLICFCLAGSSAHFLSNPIWDDAEVSHSLVIETYEENEDGIILPLIQRLQPEKQMTSISICRYIFRAVPLLAPQLPPPKFT